MNNLESNKFYISVNCQSLHVLGRIRLLTSVTTKSKWLCKLSENVWTASYEEKKNVEEEEEEEEEKEERTEIEPVTHSSAQALNSNILGSKEWRSG